TIAVAASGQRSDLLHRIEKILGVEKRKTPDFQKLGGLLAGLICIIGLNALFFFSAPVIRNNSLAFTAFSNPFYRLVSDGREFTIDKPTEQKKSESLLTQTEKEDLKEKYYTELEKVDWKKLENKLRLSYNNINWDKVNNQLGAAISTIQLDSLTDTYSVTLNGLSKAENWMTENKCHSIPDTDLNLCEVKVQKQKVERLLKTISAIKQKKIIHL